MKQDVLKAGLNACILQVIKASKNHQLGNDLSYEYYLKDLRLEIEKDKLSDFVVSEFSGNYSVSFIHEPGKVNVIIDIAPEQILSLQEARVEQQRLWLIQSFLLFILVGAGLYGVFYSLNSLFKLNKQQNNFLLSVTHEFKTPIASIRLLLQTLMNPKVSDEMKPELVDKAIQNTHRLEELTENMLTATQMEYDRYNYNRQRFSLSEMVNKIIQNHSVKGPIKAIVQDGVYVTGDEFILRIAVSNLISNAFKYSDDQMVEVELKKEKNKALISIKDTGMGIPKAEQKRIFEKFYRAQDEETRTTVGTGLGLFIVKRAILNHNGKIEVSDNQPKGAIFTITLPT